jgi:hypothetical protein
VPIRNPLGRREAQKSEQQRHPVQMDGEHLLGTTPIGPQAEFRVYAHYFKKKPIYNLRKFRFVRNAWVHTLSGLMVGEVAFLEIVDLLKTVAGEIEAKAPGTLPQEPQSWEK